MQIIQKAQRPAFFVKRDGWIEPFPLDICLENNGGGSTTSGALRLTFFTPQYTKTVDAFKTGCVTAGVGNTPTVCRMGLYTVDSAGNITLVASTPNDTALFSSTWNVKALSASYKILKGHRYATGTLYVGTGGTAPAMQGAATTAGTAFGTNNDTRLNGSVSGQTDLPGTVAYSSVANTGVRWWSGLREV